jgi:hypothetical protein
LMENPLSSSFVDLTNQDAYSPFKQEYTRLKERQAFLSEEISKAKNLVEKLYGLEPQGSFTYTLPEDIKRKEYNRFVSSLEQSPLVFETEPKNLLDPKDKYKSITGSYEYEYPDLSSSSEKVLYPRYDGKVPRRKQEYVETQEGLAPITGDYYTESPEFLRNKRVQTEEARQRIEERKRRGLNQNIKPVTSPSYLIDLSNYPVGQDVGYGVPASRVATPTIKPKTAIELALERPPKKESKDPLLSLFEKLVQKQEERKNYVLAPEIELPPFTLQGVDVNRYLLPPGSDSRRSPSPSISINKNRTLKDSMREIAKTLQPQLQPQPQPSIDPYDFEDPRFGSRQPQPQPSIDPYDFEDPRFGFRQPQLQEPTSRQPRPQTAQPQLQEPTSRQPRPQTAQPEPQPRITNLGGTETDTAQFARLTNLDGTETDTAQFARLTNLDGTETDTAQFARLTNLGGTETDTAQFAQPSISTRRNLGKVAAAAIPAAFATFFLTKYLNDKKQEEEKRNYRNNQLRNYQDFNIYE